jgi:hypothetical protein
MRTDCYRLASLPAECVRRSWPRIAVNYTRAVTDEASLRWENAIIVLLHSRNLVLRRKRHDFFAIVEINRTGAHLQGARSCLERHSKGHFDFSIEILFARPWHHEDITPDPARRRFNTWCILHTTFEVCNRRGGGNQLPQEFKTLTN